MYRPWDLGSMMAAIFKLDTQGVRACVCSFYEVKARILRPTGMTKRFFHGYFYQINSFCKMNLATFLSCVRRKIFPLSFLKFSRAYPPVL